MIKNIPHLLQDPTILSMLFLNLFYIYSATYFFVITVLLIEINSILTAKFNQNPNSKDGSNPSPSILDLPQYLYYQIYKKFIKDELSTMERLIFYIVVFTVSLKMSTKSLLLLTANVSLFVKRNYQFLVEVFDSMKNYGKITYQQMKEIDQKMCGSILSTSQSYLMEKCSPMRPSFTKNKEKEPSERLSLSAIAKMNMINKNRNNLSDSEDLDTWPSNDFEQKNKVLITSDLELEIPNLEDTLEGQVSYIFGENSLFRTGPDDSVVGKLNSTKLKSYSARALNLMSWLGLLHKKNNFVFCIFPDN